MGESNGGTGLMIKRGLWDPALCYEFFLRDIIQSHIFLSNRLDDPVYRWSDLCPDLSWYASLYGADILQFPNRFLPGGGHFIICPG